MQNAKLSLVAAMVLGFSGNVYASDALIDAFRNGKVNGEIKAWYWDKTQDNTAQHNVNIFNIAVELGYVTDLFYGFRMGATFQSNATPFADDDAKTVYVNEEYASGSVLSETYLAYTFGKTDTKVGRQYINTPIISGNYARILKEAFEGASITNTDLPQTTVFAHYVEKFQGRTSNVSGDGVGKAPVFSQKVILGGAGQTSYAFDDIYGVGFINKSIPNVTLTAQYAQATGVEMSATNKDDISFYYTEANYLLPVNNFKLGLDVNYRGSKTGSNLDTYNYEGTMLGLRVSLAELFGFGASVAYTTVSDKDSVLLGLGNGPSSYTALPIRGPFAYSCLSGMDSYKFELSYDFNKVDVSGLKGSVQYLVAEQDAPSVKTGIGASSTAAGAHSDYEGYAGVLTYAVPALKGLTTQLIYVTLEKEATSASNVVTKTDTDELWFKVSYKF